MMLRCKNTIHITGPLWWESTGGFLWQRANNAKHFEVFCWIKQVSCEWFVMPWRSCDVNVMENIACFYLAFMPADITVFITWLTIIWEYHYWHYNVQYSNVLTIGVDIRSVWRICGVFCVFKSMICFFFFLLCCCCTWYHIILYWVVTRLSAIFYAYFGYIFHARLNVCRYI